MLYFTSTSILGLFTSLDGDATLADGLFLLAVLWNLTQNDPYLDVGSNARSCGGDKLTN